MVKFMKCLLEEERSCFSVLLNVVKEGFSVEKSADYGLKILQMSCADEENKGFDNFHILYCNKCVNGN